MTTEEYKELCEAVIKRERELCETLEQKAAFLEWEEFVREEYLNA